MSIFVTVTQKITTKKRICTVRLERNNERWHMFYCNDCRNPVFQYQGDIIQLLPGLEESHTPMIALCSNDKCRKGYNVVWIVDPDVI